MKYYFKLTEHFNFWKLSTILETSFFQSGLLTFPRNYSTTFEQQTEPCSSLSTTHFNNKNVAFQQLSNLSSIKYTFFQCSIRQLGELRRYILETLSLFILKLTSEVCSLC